MLNQEELEEFIDNAVDRIEKRIKNANRLDELKQLAEQYDLLDLLEEVEPCCDYYDRSRCKVLVLAFAFHNLDEIKLYAKKEYGIKESRFEFVEFKSNFNYAKLANTSAYSDIFVGPVPHKGTGMGDTSSFLAQAQNHPELYPKVQRMMEANNELKFNKTSFMECLKNSNLVRNCL